jgi:hypothetical protein
MDLVWLAAAFAMWAAICGLATACARLQPATGRP